MNCGGARFSCSCMRAHLGSVSIVQDATHSVITYSSTAALGSKQALDIITATIVSDTTANHVFQDFILSPMLSASAYNTTLAESHRFQMKEAYLLRPRIRQAIHKIQKKRGKVPRNIKQERDSKYSPQRNEAIAHTLRRMMSHNMRNLMSQHSSQTIFIFANRQDTRVDKYLPASNKTNVSNVHYTEQHRRKESPVQTYPGSTNAFTIPGSSIT
jgi:hypothetical protein